MASANNDLVFKDGGSSNKPPLFSGQYFDFWKIRMKAHLEAQGSDIWEAVQNGLFVPTTVVNGVGSSKHKTSWDDDDKKRVLFDKKAINILQSALGMDEFFRVSTCTTIKEIWDTLVETHEGTTEVKRSRLNTSLTREWQSKVTAISEKKSLSTMISATLFGKLQEYETELGLLEKHEVQEKKSKSIALKVDSKVVKKEDNPEEDENFMRLVKRLGKYFGAENNIGNSSYTRRKKFSKNKEREASTSNEDITCYECGKQGHIKLECPKLAKNHDNKGKKDYNRKAYIAWDDNEISSSSDFDSDQSVNLALIVSHHSDDEGDEVSSNFSIFDNDAQGAIDELLSECKILYKTISSQKNQISTLEENIEKMKNNFKDEKEELIKNFACIKCESLAFQIVQLKRVIERYEKGQIGLEHVLSSQRYSNDKSCLGYSNFAKQTSNKTIFVKAIVVVGKLWRFEPP
ncbi:uncharacterized protein LOC127101987 [Lathyrus oleraceus]|uniref:uncharacterized protein LOC127101987 n=1 Tax=Pisum sativum TaxID=3888 RepID=UPI0021D0FFAF|nr:uncharacterized protein LOC127101987 [Pisum sativum]